MLAKQATCLDFVDPKSAVGLSPAVICAHVWADKEQSTHWQTIKGCRHSKMFF